MTLESIYYIGQTLAVVAILVSLIFVGIQIRQNTRALKATAGFEASHSWAMSNESLLLWDTQDMARTLEAYDPNKTWDDFEEADRIRIIIAFRGLFQKLEGQYFLYKYGSLDGSLWEGRRDWAAGLIKLPFFQEWWAFEKTQKVWSHEFVTVIETAIDSSSVVPKAK